jgi:hypothetical protein
MSDRHKNITGYSASDIEKYRKGELSAREMHELERAALEDPLLADALEGMELHPSLQQPAGTGRSEGGPPISGFDRDLEELRRRLASRVSGRKDEKKIPPYRRIRIRWAAAVILFIGAGSIAYYSLLNRPRPAAESRDAAITRPAQQVRPSPATADSTVLVPDNRTALNEKVTPAPATGVATSPASARSIAPLARKRSIPGNDSSSVATISPAAGTAPATTVHIPASAARDAELTADDRDSMALAKKIAMNEAQAKPLLSSPLPGLTISNTPPPALQMVAVDRNRVANDTATNFAMRMSRSSSGFRNNGIGSNPYNNFKSVSNSIAFSGQVLDEHNRPLAGASVYLSGHSNINTVTNRYGQFNLNNLNLIEPDSTLKVMVAHIGYEQTSISLNNPDALDNNSAAGNIIRLQPQNPSLGEVVVTGYGSRRKETFSSISTLNIDSLWIKASPVIGRIAYLNYLATASRQQALDPTIKGAEIISFDVNSKGELSLFKVEQSLSPAHDSSTIRLIQQGPPWKLMRGREVRTSVRVNY